MACQKGSAWPGMFRRRAAFAKKCGRIRFAAGSVLADSRSTRLRFLPQAARVR